MTRKDFELIASEIRNARCMNSAQKRQFAHDMAKALVSTNTAFNRDKFIQRATANGV